MYRSGSSKPKGAAHSCPSLLINVSPDSGLRQIVRRGHGGQYQDGSERFCFFTSLTKKSVKTGSPNRPALSLNLTFRGFCKNHVSKVSIASSTCPGFIYQWQKSIIIRTTDNRQTDGNISLAAPANVRSASRNNYVTKDYRFGFQTLCV